jgi:hypothetical protein
MVLERNASLPRHMSRYSYFGPFVHVPGITCRQAILSNSRARDHNLWLCMRLSFATQTAGEKRATANTPHRIEAGRGAVNVVEILVWKRKVAGKRSGGAPLSI